MKHERPFLPYGRQDIDEDDIAAVVSVLRSNFLTQGPEVDAFESALATVVGAKHVVAFANGTAALYGACFAAGLGPGDEVVTPTLTFAASANAPRYCGARPVFADVEPSAGTLSPEALARVIGPKTRAVIPVHYAGQPADLAAIAEVVRDAERRFGGTIRIIEDAAHALGATYRGEPIGSGRFGAMAMFSFHPVKHITTGEGGAIATNDDGLADTMRLFRSHGLVKDPRRTERPSPGPWYMEQVLLGQNFRLTDMQCALGRSQLRRLSAFLERRRAIAAQYDRLFADVPHVRPLGRLPESEHAFHLYVLRLDFAAIGATRAEVMKALAELGVGTQVHYIPVHRHPFYEREGWKAGDFPVAEALYEELLSIPMYPTLTDDDVARVASAVRTVVGRG